MSKKTPGFARTVDLGRLGRAGVELGGDPRRHYPKTPPGRPKTGRRFTSAKSPQPAILAPLRVSELVETLQSDEDDDESNVLRIAQTLSYTLTEIHEKHPSYFGATFVDDNDTCRRELDAWFAAFGGIIDGLGDAAALVLGCIQDRLKELFQMLLSPRRKETSVLSLDNVKPHTLLGVSSMGDELAKLKYVLEKSQVRDEDKASLNEGIDKIGMELETKASERDELESLKRELERVNERHKELVLENFNVKNETIMVECKINKLVSINEGLRKMIRDQEQMIHALIHSKDSPVMKGIGSVPVEVLHIWNQMSHFCKNILDGDILRIELDAYFPRVVTPAFKRPFFAMKQPQLVDQAVHFTSFFDEIKKTYESDGLFLHLESQIREFLTKASDLYEKNFLEFQSEREAELSRSTQRLESALESTSDQSIILRAFVSQKQLFRKLTKNQPTMDVQQRISGIYKYSTTHPIHRSACQVVLGYFGSIENPEMAEFVALVAKLSKKDKEVDLFMRFLMGDPCLHEFLFYGEVYTKCNGTGTTKADIMNSYFGPFGWKALPREKKQVLETNYVRNQTLFLPFCLALYIHCISKIQDSLTVASTSEIESVAQSILGLADSEMFEAGEFLKEMGENGKPTMTSLAILLFKRKVAFNHILFSFDPDQSDFLESVTAQPGKRKRARSAKKSKSDLAKTLPTMRRGIHVSRVINSLQSSMKTCNKD